jgi:protein gp37
MGATSIQWTDKVWNVARGCSRVSPGCGDATGGGCYAMRQAHRFSGKGGPYEGLTTLRKGGVDWTGVARFVPEMLDAPLRWRKPCRIFVNSMSDLFHHSITNEQIAAVFGVMAACPQHTFQVLTKRAERLPEWFAWMADGTCHGYDTAAITRRALMLAEDMGGPRTADLGMGEMERWPLRNVWLGVSVEDQQRADERIPYLLQTPAAVRFVSAEPLLGPVDLWDAATLRGLGKLDWCIVGSESGHGARPMRIEWAASLRDQCATRDIAFFTKQIATPRDKQGGDVSCWPPGPWPREWPEIRS